MGSVERGTLKTPSTGEGCLSSVSTALHILEGKWSILVLAQLYAGPQRFNQLRRKLDQISTKALTDTLRHLEHNEVINRQVFPTVPVTVEYSLTEKGRAFEAVLKEMEQWGQKWKKDEEKGYQ